MKKRHSRLALTLTLGATLTLTSTFTPATAYPEGPTSRVDNIHCSSLHGGLAENGLPRPNMTRSDLAEALNTTSNLGDISYLLEGISGQTSRRPGRSLWHRVEGSTGAPPRHQRFPATEPTAIFLMIPAPEPSPQPRAAPAPRCQ